MVLTFVYRRDDSFKPSELNIPNSRIRIHRLHQDRLESLLLVVLCLGGRHRHHVVPLLPPADVRNEACRRWQEQMATCKRNRLRRSDSLHRRMPAPIACSELGRGPARMEQLVGDCTHRCELRMLYRARILGGLHAFVVSHPATSPVSRVAQVHGIPRRLLRCRHALLLNECHLAPPERAHVHSSRR